MKLEDVVVEKELSIVFMGTPSFSVPVLEALIQNFKVKAIVTQPDRINGRNNQMIYSPVKQVGIDKFIAADKADIYFVAFASLKPNEYTVVTEEKPSPESKKDIKLPDACSEFNIRCINFMTMLRELKVKF